MPLSGLPFRVVNSLLDSTRNWEWLFNKFPIGATEIEDGSIGTDELADNAVTDDKLAIPPTNVPIFSAYLTDAAATLPASDVFGKVKFNAEEFDVTSNFDSTTNWRFTPSTAGYYHLVSFVKLNQSVAGLGSAIQLSLYKNGSAFKRLFMFREPGVYGDGMGGSAIVHADGSSDYFEIYGAVGRATTCTMVTGASNTFFQGAFISPKY